MDTLQSRRSFDQGVDRFISHLNDLDQTYTSQLGEIGSELKHAQVGEIVAACASKQLPLDRNVSTWTYMRNQRIAV